MSGHRAWSEIRRQQAAQLTPHQLDTLRTYQQLGTIEAVADFRGVTVDAVNETLRICRRKLGVATSREATEKAGVGARG